MIELLVVISIIAVLSTLTLVGVKAARKMINDVSTTNRIEGVLSGLSQLGAGTNETTAFIIQRDIGLKGVLTFRPSIARAQNGNEWVLSSQVVSQSASGVTLSGVASGVVVTMSGQMVPEGIAEKDRSTYINPSTNTLMNGKILWVDYWANRKTAGGLPADPGKDYADTGKRYAWLSDVDYAYTLVGSSKTTTDLDKGIYPYLPFPWGKARPVDLLSSVQKTSQSNVVDEFLLRWCDVSRTRQILWLANVAPRDLTQATMANQFASYMTDRSTKATWNDAWGNPLVAAYAMYQPPKNGTTFNNNDETTFVVPVLGGVTYKSNDMMTSISVTSSGIPYTAYINRQDHILNICKARYGTDRMVYISVAAAGLSIPEIDSTMLTSSTETDWTGTTGVLYKIWKRVVVGDPAAGIQPVCQQGGKYAAISTTNTTRAWIYDSTVPEAGKGEWMSSSWDNPPWQGVTKNTYKAPAGDPQAGTTYRCFLSAPVAFK